MQEMLSQALNEEKWKIDSKNKVLESSKIIVFHFVKAREECLAISTGAKKNEKTYSLLGVGFYDLYKLFQKYLEKYGNALKTKLKG